METRFSTLEIESRVIMASEGWFILGWMAIVSQDDATLLERFVWDRAYRTLSVWGAELTYSQPNPSSINLPGWRWAMIMQMALD